MIRVSKVACIKWYAYHILLQRVRFFTCTICNAYILIHVSIFNHWRRTYTYEKIYTYQNSCIRLIHVRNYTCLKPYVLQIIRVWNHTRYKSYTLQIICVWNDGICLDYQRHTPALQIIRVWIIRVWNHTRYKSYAYKRKAFDWAISDAPLPCLTKPSCRVTTGTVFCG